MLTIRDTQMKALVEGLGLESAVLRCVELMTEIEFDDEPLLGTDLELGEDFEPLLGTELVLPDRSSVHTDSKASGDGPPDSFLLDTELGIGEDDVTVLDTELELVEAG